MPAGLFHFGGYMFRIRSAYRLPALCAAAALLLSACTNSNDLDETPPDLGDFALGHNIVVASKMKQGPLSREATEEEMVTAMQAAIDERFGRYDGDRLYDFGISVEGYMLAQPGIPLILSPKSALIIKVTLWDDAAGKKLNDEPETITILESLSADTVVGSGLTQSKEEQLQNLTRNAAKEVERWMLMHPEWFDLAPKGSGESTGSTFTSAASVASQVAGGTAAD